MIEKHSATNAPKFTILNPGDEQWPALWRHMADPPEKIHVAGDASLLNRPTLAVVGTRRATNRGLAVARGLAQALVLKGWTIASGMALGIDTSAHHGALNSNGSTVAVMGTGPDQIYPRANIGLHEEILSSGCLVTEFDPGMPPLRHNFPLRNRLIAGLSRGVIVIEAPLQSGAMHTARVALDYDREVFAVPGPVDLEASRGCHRLLRDGAHLVETTDDVDRILGQPSGDTANQTGNKSLDLFQGALDPAPQSSARWILDRLDLEGVGRDTLRQRWPGNEETWLEGLTALELAGLIRRLPGGRIARRVWRCS